MPLVPKDRVGSDAADCSNSDKNSDTEIIVKQPDQPLEKVKSAVKWLTAYLGKPQEELNAPWIQRLCVLNGVMHVSQLYGEIREKIKFPKDPKLNRPKLANFSIMDRKYPHVFRTFLAIHILSGITSVQCSWVAIALEQRRPKLAKRLAKIASIAETFFHGPSAIALSPLVYGDKGVIPWVYGLTSCLLVLSGASALIESTEEQKVDNPKATFPELRRMACTLSIFLYVRLYSIMRGLGGLLRKQKYSMAVMTAGTAMLPIGWKSGLFPTIFWMLMFINRKTVNETHNLVVKYGADEAMKRQWRLA